MLYLIFGGLLANASTDGAYTVSSAGGILGSVSRTDVLGLYVNPASAVTDSTEFKLDTAFIMLGLDIITDGPEQDMLAERYDGSLPEGWAPIRGDLNYKGTSPIGSFGVAIPLPKGWHIGLETFVPYAKTAEFETDSVIRFHRTSGKFIWAEQNIVLAKKIELKNSELRLGGAFRGGYLTFERQNAMDTGALLYELTGNDGAILDPLLEGVQGANGSGTSVGYALGGHWIFPKFSLHAAYRSYVSVDVVGRFRMEPSNSLQAFVEGDFATTLGLPAEMYLGVSAPISIVKLEADAGITKWSNARYSSAELSNVEIGSGSEDLQELLEAYGFTDGSILGLDSRSTDNGTIDSYFARVGATVDIQEKWELFSRVGYSTSTVPSTFSSPANHDFNTINTTAAVIWTPKERFSFGLSGIYLIRPLLTVEDSIYTPTNLEYPGVSGNGEYKFNLGRVALTTHIRL